MKFIAALLLLAIALPAKAADFPNQVTIDTGALQGVAENGMVAFKGIPYAAPPVGPLRWRAPRAPAHWDGVRDAGKFGPACPQPATQWVGALPMSEDCLTINVFRPTGGASGLPVLYWIHGGALILGASGQPVYDTAAYAKRGVILVTVNYRLGRFGMFAHPALTKESADGGRIANYALMDQIAGLEWVKRNIAAFGGDPKRVAIDGESAGGLSVDTLMISPAARGLFSGAISQSGYGRGAFPRLSQTSPEGLPSGESEGLALMTKIGVETDDPAALRAVPAEKILANQSFENGATFYLDGKLVTTDMWTAFRKNEEAPVPFVIGSNSAETQEGFPADAQSAESMRRLDVDPFVTAKEQEALLGGPDGAEHKLHLLADMIFTEQARALAALHAKNGHPTYVYRFSVLTDSLADKPGARHGADVAYVFDRLDMAGNATGPRDHKIAQAIDDYWAAFVATGKPEPKSLPGWPLTNAAGTRIMNFTNDGPKPGPDPATKRLDAVAAFADKRS